MPQLAQHFLMTEDELRRYPAVVQVLEKDGISAEWTDGDGGIELRYEISEVKGLKEALQAAFPEVDFGKVDLLVVWK